MAEPANTDIPNTDRDASSSATLPQPALEEWGRGVGQAAAEGSLRLPLVVALRGPLGAGKSVLARAIARGASVRSAMPSPTYNLRFTYETDGPVVHHLDLYRLEDAEDVWELGWEELGTGEEIVLIEWPERAESLLPPDRWEVRLDFPMGDDRSAGSAAGSPGEADPVDLRTVRVSSHGSVPVPPALPGEVGS